LVIDKNAVCASANIKTYKVAVKVRFMKTLISPTPTCSCEEGINEGEPATNKSFSDFFASG
jgi:hypothetical protein